jgi:Ca-activated chloride channel family protein
LADIASTQIDPVAGLIDVPLPHEVSLLPQTWEARVAIVLLVTALGAALWRYAHLRRANRYRREALAELSRIEHGRNSGPSDLLARLTVLVRRTSLAAFPRAQVVPLIGSGWLSFLDRSYGGEEFRHGVGRLLASGPYQQTPPDAAELQSLVRLVRRWIRGHHG